MRPDMTRQPVVVNGLDLERWTYASCHTDVAVGDDWATIYTVRSMEQGQGHASVLLAHVKAHYEALGKRFGGSVALNETMRHLYQKLGIHEYREASDNHPQRGVRT